MNPTSTLEDFPTPFTSKHFKGRTKHSSAKHSASETKPLIPTEQCEYDSGHKHTALVLSNSQPDDLNQKGTSASSSSDIPLTILPAYTSLASHISNRPALQTSVSNSDIKAAVSYPDTGFTLVRDMSPFSYVHGHTSRSLPRQVSTDVDSVHFRTHPAESLKEISRMSTSQPDYCHHDACLLPVQHLQANNPSEHCSSLADSCLPSVTDNHQIDASSDQNTEVNSNLSDAIFSNSSPSQENTVTYLYSSDGNKNTMPAPQSPSKDNCRNAGTVLDVGIPEAAYGSDKCTVILSSEEREPVQVFISRGDGISEEPNQINLTETRNTKGLSGHNKLCPSNPSSPLLNCPHSSSSHLRNTSPTHQVDKHNASTSMEEPAFQLKNGVSGVSNAYHVKPNTDVNHTSSTGASPNSITQAMKPECHYPPISDKPDVCLCGNSFRIHCSQLMNNHSRHSEPARDSDCQEILGETTQPTGYAHFSSNDFISTAPYSKRFIHSPACGLGDGVTSQHSELRKPNRCLAHLTDKVDETYISEHDHQNPPGSNSVHTHAHRIYYNTSQESCDLHPCAVEMDSSALSSSAGGLSPGYIKSFVCMSPKTTNVPLGRCGPMCHCDQHLYGKTFPYCENCNNIQVADSKNTPEITPSGNRACFDGTILESQENRVGCKRDNDRNSGLLSIDSGHPVNKEGSLPRSNTSEVGLLNINGHGTSDREVPNYSILCIVATVLNPVFGLAAFLCNHYAQINFRLHRRAKANNLYFATITISTVAIFLTLVGAVLLVSHIAVGRSEAKWTATTPSTAECQGRLFGYDESLPKFFNIDFQLYCEITKNEKIMDALKRFWLEDRHNKKKFVNIEVKDKVCNETQDGQPDDVSSVNDTVMGESSSHVNHPFRNLHPSEEHIDSDSVTVYTPQLSKPFEDSGSSHNTVLSSKDGPVVPPELEEEYRQYLEGHTRIKIGSGYPFLHGSTADRNQPAQTTASMEDRPTTNLNITSGSNATET